MRDIPFQNQLISTLTFSGSLSDVKSKLKEILNATPESESETNDDTVEQVSGDPMEIPENEAIDPAVPMEQRDVSENIEETAEDKKSNDPVKQVSGDPIEKPENETIGPVEQSKEDEKSDNPVKQVSMETTNASEIPSIEEEENLWSSMNTLLTTAANPDVPIGNVMHYFVY